MKPLGDTCSQFRWVWRRVAGLWECTWTAFRGAAACSPECAPGRSQQDVRSSRDFIPCPPALSCSLETFMCISRGWMVLSTSPCVYPEVCSCPHDGLGLCAVFCSILLRIGTQVLCQLGALRGSLDPCVFHFHSLTGIFLMDVFILIN